MTTFADLKYFFHRLGGMFGWVGDLVRGWPWPLDYLAWPFDNIENVFYERDYIFDGLNSWINGIASTASSAWSYASSAYSSAQSALNWINTTGSTAYNYAISAYNTANNAWNYATSAWNWIQGADDWFAAKLAELGAWTIDLSWLVTTPLPIINMSIFDIAEWRRTKGSEIEIWYGTKRIDMENDITWLRENVSPEAIFTHVKASMVDWMTDELDRLW